MRRLLCAVTLVVALLAPAPHAQMSSAAAAIDGVRLSRLDHVLEQYVQENRIAGAVALVLQDGKPSTRRPLAGATGNRTCR